MKTMINLLLFLSCTSIANGQSRRDANYDETKVPAYQLPDLLVSESGDPVQTQADWERLRRTEILQLFEQEVYGKTPKEAIKPSKVEVLEAVDNALNNRAIRKQIRLTYTKNQHSLEINILVYLPKQIEQAPIFVGYNFFGNHTITKDPAVVLTESWLRNNPQFEITENKATEASRGKRAYRWPVEKIIDNGFGLVTIYCGDVDPDRLDYSDGIQPFFYQEGQTKPKKDEWGTIATWAWGLSEIMDYFQTDQQLKASKFILFGHSRLGKTALWAGAQDNRYDIVISNNSGCGGAALFRRKFGETAAIINTGFPHWFAKNFKKYNNNEETLPVDQHMLIALMAPRPVYIASAKEDQWADPKGEYLAAYHAGSAYELYGMSTFAESNPPEVGQPIHTTIGYHIRAGKHDVTDYDWEQYLKFASLHLK